PILHYSYRIWVNRSNSAPIHWIRFLDWSSQHLYLRRQGPAYTWSHIELRDYFADRYSSLMRSAGATKIIQLEADNGQRSRESDVSISLPDEARNLTDRP